MKSPFIGLLCCLLFSNIALAQAESGWRSPDIRDLVYMQTSEGLVIIELAPFMAPKHVQRFKDLVASGYYDNLDFYRVIDGFVAQAGDMSEQKATKFKRPLKAEFSRPTPADSDFKLVQDGDFMAPQTGYLHGFSAGRDPQAKQEWLLHCPGTVAMARSNEKDSATSDFYIVIGQATRHLDRNMSSFGKVIYGMPAIQSLNRASVNQASGVIDTPAQRSLINWVKLAENIAIEDRIYVQVQEQNSADVQQRLDSAKKLDNPFFHYKGNGNLDMCYYQLKTRIKV
ncbi:peptidylprolyl isomerase [Aliiglaciecola sp. LCG003]|uniref:peptidylprolyl isomerase n=1 Tax=Aliiglaciecola sp. LCG003 TaxID=3053655 RepID=UPI00257485D4|nr:peptidylprolyl isomerase [Aliiglaciecola sp. LCG003]WJG07831.1 peptidylprolyl isomerase [Aliiglaciecola sp. LCG003]